MKNGEGYIKEFNNYGNIIFIGSYFNGKINGNGKEYDDNRCLIFEGEYKDWKRWNGKGYNGEKNVVYELKNGIGNVKEYEDNILTFEGEYLNGERNGKGKEYGKDGKLIFEGIYLNGKRIGKGKEYYKSGELKFEGEYLNGERNGEGKEYYKNGELKFEGEFLYYFKKRGRRFIKGRIEYEGEYEYGKNGI